MHTFVILIKRHFKRFSIDPECVKIYNVTLRRVRTTIVAVEKQ